MTERKSKVQRDHQTLQEIFVSVTGETVITDRQEQETNKKVIGPTESDSPPDEHRFDADQAARELEDAIGDPKTK